MVRTSLKKQREQVKGILFEVIVRRLLAKADYAPIKPDNKCVRKSDGKVRGRGCWHNIDAFGRHTYPTLYVYPIRLLAEAKCYDRNVPLLAVQNFVGAVKDISENYFVRDKLSHEEIVTYNRYTDCGAVFSASDFSPDAQRLALAHGISMISYANNAVLRKTIDSMYALMPSINMSRASRKKADFSRYIDDKLSGRPQKAYWSGFIRPQRRSAFGEDFRGLLNSIESIKTSVMATAIGKDAEIQYPIHLLSYDAIPEEIFASTDTYLFRVHYSLSENGLIFRVNPVNTEVQLYFSLPRSIYQSYFARQKMLDFKYKFLNRIELPIVIHNMRRIVTLELDTQWIEEQRARSFGPRGTITRE